MLLILGLLYTSSSVFLFEAYSYIASGLATTIIFLYPVLVAIIMVFLRVVPSWPVWLSIILTFVGVVIMTQSDSTQTINPIGVILSLGSALVYALFIVIINRSKIISNISNSLLTFYALTVGAIIFLGKITLSDIHITTGLTGNMVWLNLVGLAILPTVVSSAIAIAAAISSSLPSSFSRAIATAAATSGLISPDFLLPLRPLRSPPHSKFCALPIHK